MTEVRERGDDWLDIESVDHVLSTARSVRRNLDFERPVEPEVLFECINVSTQAPTGIGGESWRFVVVTDGAKKQQLADVYREVITDLERQRGLQIKATQRALMDRLHEIPAMIFVCYIGTAPGPEIPAQVGFYGSVLPSSSRQAEVGAILQVPDGVVQTVMFPVGYMKGATLRKADRKDAREVTYWNQWGNHSPVG